MMLKQIKTSVMLLLVFTLLLGVVYPLVVTGIAQLAFSHKANGSMIVSNDGKVVGSELVGQNFTSPKYFWGRLSATSDVPYNASASGASNYSFTHPKLTENAKGRIDALKKSGSLSGDEIPVELITASASGIDPEISVDAAMYQAARVAKARGKSEEEIKSLIEVSKEPKFMWVFGDERVNVLKLNLSLDEMLDKKSK